MGDTKMVSSRPLSLMEAMSVYWGFVSVYYRNGISKISVNMDVGSLSNEQFVRATCPLIASNRWPTVG